VRAKPQEMTHKSPSASRHNHPLRIASPYETRVPGTHPGSNPRPNDAQNCPAQSQRIALPLQQSSQTNTVLTHHPAPTLRATHMPDQMYGISTPLPQCSSIGHTRRAVDEEQLWLCGDIACGLGSGVGVFSAKFQAKPAGAQIYGILVARLCGRLHWLKGIGVVLSFCIRSNGSTARLKRLFAS